MSRLSLRKLAATGLGAALIGSGLTVGLGAGIASADTDTCKLSTQVKLEPTIAAGPLIHSYTYAKTANVDKVPADGLVTYKTTIWTKEGLPLVYSVIDTPPTDFELVGAWVTALQAGKERNAVTPSPAGAGFKVANTTGWMVTPAKPLIVEMQYRVPKAVAAGTEITSGGTAVTGTLKINADLPNVTSCVTVRAKNPIESATGSLDDIGLGSVNTGSGNIFGSATDPAGSVGNIVDGIDSRDFCSPIDSRFFESALKNLIDRARSSAAFRGKLPSAAGLDSATWLGEGELIVLAPPQLFADGPWFDGQRVNPG